MNSLNDPKVAACLDRLHEAAAGDGARYAARSQRERDDDSLTRMGNLYLAVSRAEGRLLYLLARGAHARYIVEFGASFGVSTIYLAAAARDNGGRLVTTEAHPDKLDATRRMLAEAGLGAVATLLEGDARETLADCEPGIDFLFLDGWKGMYLPVLELLQPKLVAGALIAADNIDHEGAAPYAEYVRTQREFVSHSLGKIELSCWAGLSDVLEPAGSSSAMSEAELAELRESFEYNDSDGSGRLEYAEFKRMLDALGARMGNPAARVGFEAIDTDRDGAIEFDEFVAWWCDR